MKRFSLICLAVTGLFLLAPAVQAQTRSYHGGGHRTGFYGAGFRSSFYAAPIVAPYVTYAAPIVYQQPVVVQQPLIQQPVVVQQELVQPLIQQPLVQYQVAQPFCGFSAGYGCSAVGVQRFSYGGYRGGAFLRR